jgi:integrase
VLPIATVSSRPKSWRVQIRRLGHAPLSKSFPKKHFTKSQAWAWADRAERELLAGTFAAARETLGQALEKYAAEVSPKKRGARWEAYRLAAIGKSPMASLPMGNITPAVLASWRDRRLREVAGSTVRREMNLIDSVLEVTRKEWKWIQVNPLRDVAKPPNPRSRRRRVPDTETKALCAQLERGPAGREVAAGFRLGIETGMRAGELWSLEREQIDLGRAVARLEVTKNGDARDVPLSPAAVAIMRDLLADERQMLFTVTNASRDALFRKARDTVGIKDLHFHDSRAEAVWRLSKIFNALELGRIIGHRDPKSLYFYYEDDAAALATRFAQPGASRRPKPRRQTIAGRKSHPAVAPASGTRGRPRSSAPGSRRSARKP